MKLSSFALVLLIVGSTCHAQLSTRNTIVLFGMVNKLNSAAVEWGLKELRKENPTMPLYLVIHSNGGEMDSGISLANAVSKDKNLHAIVIWAASAAAGVSQAIGGRVFMVPEGQLLFHEVRLRLFSPIVLMKDAHRMLDALTKDNKTFAKVCNSRMALKDYEKRIAEDWVLDANEALKLKAADEINKLKCDDILKAANVMVPTYDKISGLQTVTNFCNLL